MAAPENDQLNELLKDSWSIAGYSVCMLAGGLLAHNMLLQKADRVQSITIVSEKEKEISRTFRIFSPKPAKPEKKGIFG